MSTPTTFNDLFDAFMDDLASRVAAKISSNGVVHPSSTNGTSTSTPSLSPPTLRVVSSMPKRPSDREEPWTQAELEALNKPALVAAADAFGVPHGPKPRAKSLIRDILVLEAEAAVAPNFAFVVDDDSEEDVEDEAVEPESEDVPEEKAIDLSEDTDDDDDDYWTQAELDDMSTAQLRQVALSFTIKGYDTLDRDELIEAILAE